MVIVRFTDIPNGYFLVNEDEFLPRKQIDADLLAIFSQVAQQTGIGIRRTRIITTLKTKRRSDRFNQTGRSHIGLIFDPSVVVRPDPSRLGGFFLFNDPLQSNVIAFRCWTLPFACGINWKVNRINREFKASLADLIVHIFNCRSFSKSRRLSMMAGCRL